ncbi:FkbM family methyltransferase [Terrihabitans sp. B22-R8]|uniref:FkbM family methyltransferase n=1 Tax=Terrihabitans sp. B22-R8 TaxID=3425128 RepID=UPI00403CB98F
MLAKGGLTQGLSGPVTPPNGQVLLPALKGGDIAICRSKHGRLFFPQNDDTVGRSLEHYGEWAENELAFLLQFVRPGSTVVEVGANIGVHTLAFAEALGRSGRVVSIETREILSALLAANVQNNSTENVVVHSPAAWGRPDVVSPKGHTQSVSEDDGIPVIRVDDLDVTECSLLKIRARGDECAIISGASQIIGMQNPVISIEIDDVQRAIAARDQLRSYPYETYIVQADAFNPRNIKSNAGNMFGVATETFLLALPKGRDAPSVTAGIVLKPVASTGDLICALQEAPRSGDLTPFDRRPELLLRLLLNLGLSGDEIARQDIERFQIREYLLQKLQGEREKHLREEDTHNAGSLGELEDLRFRLSKIERSSSWRFTRPLRAFARAFRSASRWIRGKRVAL